MKISKNVSITKSAGSYLLNGECNEHVPQAELHNLYRACRGMSEEQKLSVFNRMMQEGRLPFFASDNTLMDTKEVIQNAMGELINFFSEFDFLPNFRFVNTLAHEIQMKNENNYICNYFRLIDSPYAQEIENKLNSIEFENIMENLRKVTPTHSVNNRFKIYFGPQGTGKTTAALKETDNLSMVCNASLLPADLMEDFCFDDGKAAFHPSVLTRCMEEGKPIVLDEINLLPFDSLRFLQGILDGKTEINYKGHDIHIKDGFKIIGTMNLVVNGVTFGLPEPLADRCEHIKEFKLTAEDLVSAIL